MSSVNPRSKQPQQLPPISGILEKKGLGWLYRPWAKRDFLYNPKTSHLTYSFEGVHKGTVALDNKFKAKLIPPEKANGKNCAFEVMCYKILENGEKSNQLKRYEMFST